MTYDCIEQDGEPCEPVQTDKREATARCRHCGLVQSLERWETEDIDVEIER